MQLWTLNGVRSRGSLPPEGYCNDPRHPVTDAGTLDSRRRLVNDPATPGGGDDDADLCLNSHPHRQLSARLVRDPLRLNHLQTFGII